MEYFHLFYRSIIKFIKRNKHIVYNYIIDAYIYTHVRVDTLMLMKVSERAKPYACKTSSPSQIVSYIKIILTNILILGFSFTQSLYKSL